MEHSVLHCLEDYREQVAYWRRKCDDLTIEVARLKEENFQLRLEKAATVMKDPSADASSKAEESSQSCFVPVPKPRARFIMHRARSMQQRRLRADELQQASVVVGRAGTCLICGLKTKYLSTHLFRQHSNLPNKPFARHYPEDDSFNSFLRNIRAHCKGYSLEREERQRERKREYIVTYIIFRRCQSLRLSKYGVRIERTRGAPSNGV